MPWGARKEDGVWRLCERKGITIHRAGSMEIAFKSQARAKACADVLNAEFWNLYTNIKKGRIQEPKNFRDRMVACIKEFME